MTSDEKRDESGYRYRGVPIERHTKEQLIQIVIQLMAINTQQMADHMKRMDSMFSLLKGRRQ